MLQILSIHKAASQLADFNVQLLGEGDGIRTSNILKMVKDIHGFLWMLSPRYVQQFDGHNLKRFDVAGEDLLDIVADRNGQIWVSTQSTVKRLSHDHKRFVDVKIEGPLPTKFNGLQIASDNRIWMISGKGLFTFDEKQDVFRHHPIPALMQMLFYRKIFQKYGDEFFIGNTHMLFAYNVKTRKVRRMAFEAVSNIVPFSKDILWVTNARLQLFELNFKTGKTTPIAASRFFPKTESHFLEINAVVALDTDRYLVTTSKGCYRYSRKTNIFSKATLFHYGSELANNEIYTSHYDADKTLWMLGQQGIIFFKPLQHTISWLRSFSRPGNEWNNNIRAITRDAAGNIWMATAAGLTRLDLKEGKVKSYHPGGKTSASFQYPAIQGIVFDQGKLVLGPGSGGVLIFDPVKETFSKPDYPSGNATLRRKAEQDYIYSIVRLHNGNLLVMGDLSCYLVQKGSYRLSELSFEGADFILQTAAQDASGKIWMGTFKGLLLLDSTFKTLAADTTLSPSRLVTSLLVRNDSVAWAGSVGIFEYTKTNKGFRKRNIIPQLKNQQVTMLFEDKTGRIWIGADDGLYRYDSKSRKLEWFDIWDNVQNKQLNPNSRFEAPDGTLYLGGNNGLNYFHPEKIEAPKKDLDVLITSVKVNQNDSLYSGAPLALNWDENSVEIQFITTYFQNVQKVKYRYQLLGLDKGWVLNASNNTVRFSSLAPGGYIFNVQASLDGITWHSAPKPLHFSISAPVWQRFWFIALSFILTFALGYYLFRRRVASIRRQQAEVFALQSKANMLEKEKALAMYEGLKQQLNPHFLFNSLTSLDSLIWMDAGKASKFLDGLSRTYRYILKNREKEVVSLADEIHFAESYIALQSARFGSGLQVNICIPQARRHFRIAPVTLQNLIENAIKHNMLSDDAPLIVDIVIEDQHLVVRNNLQKKNFVETSNKQGLSNLTSLYSYLSAEPVRIVQTDLNFEVHIPLL